MWVGEVGSGPTSPEHWAPFLVGLPHPDDRESRSTPAQASWLWKLPHCTPNSQAVTRSGIPKAWSWGIFIPHLVRYFFRKKIWVKGGSWEEWSRRAALSLRFWLPTAAALGTYLRVLSGFALGFFLVPSVQEVDFFVFKNASPFRPPPNTAPPPPACAFLRGTDLFGFVVKTGASRISPDLNPCFTGLDGYLPVFSRLLYDMETVIVPASQDGFKE